MKKIILSTIAVVLLLLLVLRKPLCGEVTEELQHKIARVKDAYGDKVEIEIIPCETRYLNIRLKQVPVRQVPLDSIHSILYDKANRSGWVTLLVYDTDGKYLFSHSSENKIYIQHGD